MTTKERLDYLRTEIQNEHISYSEIAELQSLSEHIDPSDTELLQWAGREEGDHVMITDTTARKIASEWHGGGGTALYAFSSTGAIDTARNDHDIANEIAEIMHNADLSERDDEDLTSLYGYIMHHDAERGPVEGWSNLAW